MTTEEERSRGIFVGLIAGGYYAGLAIPAVPLIVLDVDAVPFLAWVARIGWRLRRSGRAVAWTG